MNKLDGGGIELYFAVMKDRLELPELYMTIPTYRGEDAELRVGMRHNSMNSITVLLGISLGGFDNLAVSRCGDLHGDSLN